MGAGWGADSGVVRQKVKHVRGAAMEQARSTTGNQSVGNKAPNILVECEAAVGKNKGLEESLPWRGEPEDLG